MLLTHPGGRMIEELLLPFLWLTINQCVDRFISEQVYLRCIYAS